ncbi:MAG: tail fiber protein [Endomicrobiales bacterium]|nr:tail fiber protein [Endomicrobiales bacterium]
MKRLFLLLCIQIIVTAAVFAEVPNEITYTGRLREYGQPASGTKTMCFKIYDAATAGSEKWTSGNVSVTVSNGVFTYTLEPNIDWRGKDYWIETMISNKTLSPREKLTASAYAFHSRTAEDIEKSSGQNIHFAIGGSTLATITTDGRIKDKTGFVMPVGTILSYGGATAPEGWFLCDGTVKPKNTYLELFDAIGYAFGGSGDNFNLPDLRGRFLRGWDNGAGRDPDSGNRTEMNSGGNDGDNIGSIQVSTITAHSHTGSVGTSSLQVEETIGVSYSQPVGVTSINTVGGKETRPINAYVNYIIKY